MGLPPTAWSSKYEQDLVKGIVHAQREGIQIMNTSVQACASGTISGSSARQQLKKAKDLVAMVRSVVESTPSALGGSMLLIYPISFLQAEIH